MGAFSKFKTDTKAQDQGDRIGGGFQAIPTNVYEALIKVAYMTTAASGGTNVTLVAEIDGKEYKELCYVANKDGETSFADKNDPKLRRPYPGFTTINDICLLVTGEELSDQPDAMKIVKVYDSATKTEVNKEVPVIESLMGQKIKLGIQRRIVNKQKKNDAGKYEDLAETRTENAIDKVFDFETGKTVTEFRQGIDEAEFMKTWTTTFAGKDQDRVKAVNGTSGPSLAGSGRPGAAAGGGASAGKLNLFKK